MPGHPTARALLIATSLCMGLLPHAVAQRMVSIDGSTVNMRAGPSTRSEVLWELSRGYPLQVLQRRSQWLRVKDFEGDTGWVARALTGRTPHHVVKRPVANVRSGPGTQYRIVGKAVYGEVVVTRETRGSWVHVGREGAAPGWIAKRLLWGW